MTQKGSSSTISFDFNTIFILCIFSIDDLRAHGIAIPVTSSQPSKGVFMTSKYIYHYVYRITNVVENKHYYGKRSSKCDPKEDLGKKYFSSSTDKEFKIDQKLNPQNYRYKIVARFHTAYLAITRESKLHDLFNVGSNKKFYNKVKQKSSWFDSTGITMSEETRRKISIKAKGRPCPTNSRIASSKYWKGRSKSEEQKLKMRLAALGKKKAPESVEKSAAAKRGIHLTAEHKSKLSGIKNKFFDGYYITPNDILSIRKELDSLGVSKSWCKNSSRIINNSSYSQSNYLKQNYSRAEILGKTFEELGFGFIPKELFFPIICILFILQPT